MMRPTSLDDSLPVAPILLVLFLAVLVVLLLAACGRIGADAKHCALVELLPAPSEAECHPTGDGSIVCSGGGFDLAPERWGACVEDKQREFTCLKDGKISHYKSGPPAAWAIKADSCPLLVKQILEYGDSGKQIEIPIPIVPVVPRPVPAERRSKK